MPRPRFENLPEEKRHRILQAAANEFSEHGYEKASMNRILSNAGISKGAAYYYFDDKADLFASTLEHFANYLSNTINVESMLETLTPENYWSLVIELYVQHAMWAYEHPWVSGLIHAAWNLSEESLEQAALRRQFEALEESAKGIIFMGQQLGAIRTDLPSDLLMQLVFSIDYANDAWLSENIDNYSQDELAQLARKVAMMLQGILETPTK